MSESESSEWFTIAITVLIFLMKFSLGFNTRVAYLSFFHGKYSLLFRSLFAAVILPPIIALVLVEVFNPGILVAAALLLLSAAPGAPMAALKVYKYQGRYAFGISLQILLVALSVFTLPWALSLFRFYFDLELDTSIWEVSKEIFFVVVVPLALGILVGLYRPRWVDSFGKQLARGVNILLTVAALPVVWFFRDSFLKLSLSDYLMFTLFVFLLFLTGHYLAGTKERRDRITLAVVSASRHIGICIFVAVKSFEQLEFLRILIPYVLVNVVLGVIYDNLTPEPTEENR